jgi:hypothetical protein
MLAEPVDVVGRHQVLSSRRQSLLSLILGGGPVYRLFILANRKNAENKPKKTARDGRKVAD